MAEQSPPKTNALQVPSGVSPQLQKYAPDTSKANWKSTQYMPGIATEVESEWVEKLYQKFKEIDNIKTLLQSTINDLDKDHVLQKQALNDSFGSMICLLESRRDLLLSTMNDKVVIYKKDLNQQMVQMISTRKELAQTKKQYDENVNNKQLTDIEQRENDNIKIISDALKNYKCDIAGKVKPKHPTFVINQNAVDKYLNNVADFILKTEMPEPPIVSVLVRTSETTLIEVLMDEKCNQDPVLKYELDILKGAFDEKEYENVKDDEYLKVDCDVILEDNICFFMIDDLDDNESYNIRVRAILKNGDVAGKYSKWLPFKTKPLGSDDEEEDKDDIVPYNAEDESKMEEAWNKNMEDESLKNREINDFDAWSLIFKRVDLGLSVYQQKRMFFCMQQVEQGPGSKIVSGEFANFVLNVGQRFDSKEWKNMCKTIRERVLKK